MEKKVTVVCVTYNQEPYIRQALDGMLMQKTDFAYEILVGDDASTDGTAAIVREYAEKHPDKMTAVLREKNIGAGKNSTDLYGRIRTPYVAVCDGDDYWIDENKLQKQVDFLESHPECGLCLTHLRMIFEESGQPDEIVPEPRFRETYARRGLDARDLILYNFITPVAVMWRWRFKEGLPDWCDLSTLVPGDLCMNLLHLKDGRIGLIDDITAVYRRHSGGIWLNAEKTLYKTYGVSIISLLSFLKKNWFDGENTVYFNRAIRNLTEKIIQESIASGDPSVFIALTQKAPEELLTFCHETLEEIRRLRRKLPLVSGFRGFLRKIRKHLRPD